MKSASKFWKRPRRNLFCGARYKIMAKQPKRYIITKTRGFNGKVYTSEPLILEEAINNYEYTLEAGASYQHEKGNKKINLHPKTISSLITNLNNSSRNRASNGYGDYYVAEEFVQESINLP